MGRIRYTVDQIRNNRYYQMPKFLFEEEFETLSSDAIVLYSLLRDRLDLSSANGWVNKQGEVFLIYTRENMANMLRCSQPTVRKAVSQLKKCGLMEEEKLGFNRPNHIYLTAVSADITGVKKSFTPECKDLSVRSERIFHYGVKRSFTMECKNLSPNKTENSKTDINETESNETEGEQQQQQDPKYNNINTNHAIDYVDIDKEQSKNENNYSAKEIKSIKDKVDAKLGSKISKSALSSLVKKHGKEKVEYYLNNWNKFESTSKRNAVGFFINAVNGEWDFPKQEKQQTQYAQQGKPVQMTNYQQREYSEEDFQEMYDNLIIE